MKSRLWILVLIALLLGGGVALWVRSRMEKGPYEETVGFQGEAKYNDFLMAQRFLEKQGTASKSLWHLPTEGDLKDLDTVLMPRRGRRLSPAQAESLLNWVQGGGTLLAEGAWSEEGDGIDSQDPIFAAFGVRKRSHRPDPKEGEAGWKRMMEKAQPASVRIGKEEFSLALERWSVLEAKGAKPVVEIEDDEGPKLLVFHRGKGRAVLLNGLGFLDNGSFPKEDHAAFLAALLEHSKGAAIVVREDAPSLRLWLMEHARLPLAVLALLVLLALWKAMPRFGPFIPDPMPGRRSLLEHLAACGRFQWRHRDGRSLLMAAREALMARLRRVHPAWAAMEPDRLCAQLAAFSGLSEEAIFQALRYDTQPDSRSFLAALQTLDLLRKKL